MISDSLLGFGTNLPGYGAAAASGKAGKAHPAFQYTLPDHTAPGNQQNRLK